LIFERPLVGAIAARLNLGPRRARSAGQRQEQVGRPAGENRLHAEGANHDPAVDATRPRGAARCHGDERDRRRQRQLDPSRAG
jgi:hypothetical protein